MPAGAPLTRGDARTAQRRGRPGGAGGGQAVVCLLARTLGPLPGRLAGRALCCGRSPSRATPSPWPGGRSRMRPCATRLRVCASGPARAGRVRPCSGSPASCSRRPSSATKRRCHRPRPPSASRALDGGCAQISSATSSRPAPPREGAGAESPRARFRLHRGGRALAARLRAGRGSAPARAHRSGRRVAGWRGRRL